MTQTERSGRRSVSPCLHPEDEEDLGLPVNVTGVGSRELGFLRAEPAGVCFRPEDEEDLGLHVGLSRVDSRELEFLRDGATAGDSVVH